MKNQFLTDKAIPSRPDGRMVGGTEASQGRFTYIVSIQHAGVKPPVHVCTENILD